MVWEEMKNVQLTLYPRALQAGKAVSFDTNHLLNIECMRFSVLDILQVSPQLVSAVTCEMYMISSPPCNTVWVLQ